MKKYASKFYHHVIGRAVAKTRDYLYLSVAKKSDGIYFVKPQPVYLSQFALSDSSLIDKQSGKIRDESAAKRFGAYDLDDLSYWAWRSCAIVCIQMVLGAKTDKTTRTLIDEGLELCGYDTQNDIGWYHTSLVMLAKKNGLSAKAKKFVAINQIASFLFENQPVMASVKSKSGGHFLLVYGVSIKNGRLEKFIVHDPYDLKTSGQAKEISTNEFNKLFTRRIIILSTK